MKVHMANPTQCHVVFLSVVPKKVQSRDKQTRRQFSRSSDVFSASVIHFMMNMSGSYQLDPEIRYDYVIMLYIYMLHYAEEIRSRSR